MYLPCWKDATMGSRLLELQSSGAMAVIDNITGWPRHRAAQVRIQGRVFSCALYCPNLSLALLSAHGFRTLHNHPPGCVIRNHGLLHLGSSLGGCCPFSDSQCSTVPSQGGKVVPGSYLLSHSSTHGIPLHCRLIGCRNHNPVKALIWV